MKKILMSLLTVAIAGALVTGGVFAYFSDTETSTGNTFTAGTMYLEIGDWNEDIGSGGVSATWTMSDMEPGVTTVSPLSVNIGNAGSLLGDHIEISFSHVINDLPHVESDTKPDSTPGDMARWLEITQMTYDGINWGADFIANNTARDPNGNGFFDLDDLTWPSYADAGGFLDDLLAPLWNGSRMLTMDLKFNAGATDDIQGDTLTTTVTFTLNQHSSQ